MRNSISDQKNIEPPILVYRRNDSSPLFGAAVLLALRQQMDAAALVSSPSGLVMGKILECFPGNSSQKYVGSLPLERFRTKGPLTPAYLETLLLPCDNESAPLNESYFLYRGYMIDPGQRQFNVLRGDPMEIPTQELCERFSDLQKIYASMLMPLRHSVYFPYRIEKSYSLDALPLVLDFLSDVHSLG